MGDDNGPSSAIGAVNHPSNDGGDENDNNNDGGDTNPSSDSGDDLSEESEQDVKENMGLLRPPRDPRRRMLRAKTQSDISRWTKGMIKTSYVDLITERVVQGAHTMSTLMDVMQESIGAGWMTITGNPGDGKTTTAYMVLKELDDRGKEVFHVREPEQYFTVTATSDPCVIMLNDILGSFSFDPLSLTKWQPVIFSALDDMAKCRELGVPCSITVIFVSRWNVLQGAKDMLGRYGMDILGEASVVNVGKQKGSATEERMGILDHHLARAGVTDVTTDEKERVVSETLVHGFPQCCKIFADLKQKKGSEKLKIVEYFLKPLRFLNDTTNVLLQNEHHEKLFKKMLRNDGQLEISSLTPKKQCLEIASRSLIGSYLNRNVDTVSFSHSSIHQSVAICIAGRNISFAIEEYNVSLLLQIVKFRESHEEMEKTDSCIFVLPTQANMVKLSKRCSRALLQGNYLVLQHQLFLNVQLCDTVLASVTLRRGFGWLVKLMKMVHRKPRKLPVNQRDQNRDTLLTLAARGGNSHAVQTLLSRGAKADKPDNNGDTPLLLLCKSANPGTAAIRMLVERGADARRADDRKKTALHYLCTNEKCDEGSIDVLIAHGARGDVHDNIGRTPIHFLCENKRADVNMIVALLKQATDINAADSSGWTALHRLCLNESLEVEAIDLLVEFGADVNSTSNAGRTPLHFLCRNKTVTGSSIECLILRGSDVNRKDDLGSTPFHCLCENTKADENTMDVFIQHGADINAVTEDGRTPISFVRNVKLREKLSARLEQ